MQSAEYLARSFLIICRNFFKINKNSREKAINYSCTFIESAMELVVLFLPKSNGLHT